jgi:hypothetical protein
VGAQSARQDFSGQRRARPFGAEGQTLGARPLQKETAARLKWWEFLFQAAPIPVTGATGSLNAIATF